MTDAHESQYRQREHELRDNITEIIELLISRGVSETEAPLIAAELIAIGARAAVYRRETADAVAELLVNRHERLVRR